MTFKVLDIHHTRSGNRIVISIFEDKYSTISAIYQYDRWTTSYAILNNVIFIKLELLYT